jgi:hypothetical protein
MDLRVAWPEPLPAEHTHRDFNSENDTPRAFSRT